MRVLLVDDERSAREVLARIVRSVGDVEIHEAAAAPEAMELLDRFVFDAILVDLRLSADEDAREGLSLVADARRRSILSIVVSGSQDIAAVRSAMRLGAHDYILKDQLSEELIVPVLRTIKNQCALAREVAELRSRHQASSSPWLIGGSRAMQQLRATIQRVATSERPVLVTGPTGSGKELVVRSVHALGPHPEAPLLDLNCAAFPESLMEAQLFGHEKGAFTGADRKQDGLLAAVGTGTLFLDELGELARELQAKLLRVLETGLFRPIGGGVQSRQFVGRIVAATCADLEARVATGHFREDLYYRLNVLEIRVPGLEERREDIPMLVTHFASTQARPLVFTGEALVFAQRMRWPGNVRQLRNLIDRLSVFAPEGPVTVEAIEQFSGARPPPAATSPLASFAQEVLKSDAPDKLRLAEDALIQQALAVTDGNKAAAARLLGVHRKVVERRSIRGA